jgi:hypothetical protein
VLMELSEWRREDDLYEGLTGFFCLGHLGVEPGGRWRHWHFKASRGKLGIGLGYGGQPSMVGRGLK